MALPLAQQQPVLAWGGDTPSTREVILARYLHLREISKRLHEGVLESISSDALLSHARRLGLAQGKTFILDDMDEMYYVYDLAIYTAPGIVRGQSTATRGRPSLTAVRRAADARRDACVAVCDLLIQQRHDTLGLIAADILRNSKVWLLDVGLESSMDDGELIATRLIAPGPFSMTAGVNIPFGIEMLEADLHAAAAAHGQSQVEPDSGGQALR